MFKKKERERKPVLETLYKDRESQGKSYERGRRVRREPDSGNSREETARRKPLMRKSLVF